VLRIEDLTIDDHILDKIESKHGVSFEEVRDTCFSDAYQVRRSRGGLYKLFGQTTAGRHILVVLVSRGEGLWRIVTAREMTDKERRLYVKTKGT
jgi:uncharacterized DUF497 family protein